MNRSRSNRLPRFAAIIAVIAIVGPIWLVPASGQSGARTASVSPATGLVDGQYIAITFAGFPAGEDVRARQCPTGFKTVARCKPDGQSLRESGLTRVSSSGTGGLSLVIRSGEITGVDGNTFLCDFRNACDLVVFELDQNTGDELGIDRSALAPLPFARSTVTCPRPKGPGRVAGSGATAPAASMVEWQAETCGKPMKLQVSSIVTNSLNGKEAFVQALSDSEFAISALPLDEEERNALESAGREAVHVPLTAGSLSFSYNYWEDFNRCDSDPVREQVTSMRMSAETLAYVITGRLGNMSDERIAADNPHLVAKTRVKDADGNCVSGTRLPGRIVKPVGRADNSAATWTLSSWMLANAPEAWRSAGPEFQEPTEIFPAYNFVDLRTGSAAVARQVKTFDGGQGVGDIPEAMWIGFVDTSVGRQLGLPSVAVRNPAGNFVAPSTDSVLASLEAATLNDEGTVTPNYAATSPANLYPLLTVSYLITDRSKLSEAQAKTIRSFAAYAITDGQETAADRGYAPMPAQMQASAARSIEQIQGTGGPDGGDGNDDDPPSGGGGGGAGSFGDDDDGADDGATRERLEAAGVAGVRGGFAAAGTGGDSGADGPIEGGSLASQQLGPAGGPAGVVRALTVFLGVPVLIALGVGALLAGRTLGLMSEPGRFGAAVAVGWRKGLRWRAM